MGAGSGARSRSGLFSFLLLNFLDLVEQFIGLLGKGIAFGGGLDHVGLATVEEVEIGHGILVIGLEFDGLFEVVDTVFDHGAELLGGRFADIRGKRIGVLDLLVDVSLVVVGAHFGVAAIGLGPIDNADGIVRSGIVGLQLNVLLVVFLGLFKLFGVERLASHLVEDGGKTVDSVEVVGIFFEHALIFGDGLFTVIEVFIRRSAGNVLAGVSGGEIKASIDKVGIEFLGLLEILDGLIELGFLEGGHTLVEKIARLELVAARNAEEKNKNGGQRKKLAGKAGKPRGGFPCNRCMSH